MAVRAPNGAKIHAVRAVGDASGETRCGLRGRSWTLVPDAAPDCLRCLQKIAGTGRGA